MTLAPGRTGLVPGPQASDEQLAAWRDAVGRAALPDPVTTRWTALRSGVVNLWEFDVAEYWFADGRAQFVGANQSGKSTLMALTTLIMLAGSLERQYIDTFGQADKAFRYYVEPTTDERDRRDATASTNRGWAWVEYGRIDESGQAQFFTMLLYAQAKRGVNQLSPVWIICDGAARIRAGIDLVVGQAVADPKDLQAVAGMTVFDSGKRYADRLATDLFGFTDIDRYATVLEMLKVLRTPHLGQRLNPDWFTRQIRSALPPIDRGEVAELAEGWQQLEQLGRDRDDAAAARDAIGAYLSKAWRPWADAVLRLHAEDLLLADTAVQAGDTAVRDAAGVLEQARAALTREMANTTRLEEAGRKVRAAFTALLRDAAYTDAVNRAGNAKHLRALAEAAQAAATKAGQDLARLREIAARRAAASKTAEGKLQDAATLLADAGRHTSTAVLRAGMGEQATAWVRERDTDRLAAAANGRRTHIAAMRRLMRTARDAAAAWRSADNAAAGAQAEHDERLSAVTVAGDALTNALQLLSENLERWAIARGETAPPAELRDRWIEQVAAQATTDRPRQVLHQLITAGWLNPAITPLLEQAAALRADATTADRRAEAATSEADQLQQAPTPAAPVPAGWGRRARPEAPGPQGAPLWRLIDPVDGLDPQVLDHVEAALAAAGLLDAWVTPDGVWAEDRDGDDIVITTGQAEIPPASTLAAVLQPADDAGQLRATVHAILTSIGYAGPQQPLDGPTAVTGDGRWRTDTAAGRAGPAEHGAELIGAAARSAALQRRIAELREQASTQRATAGRLREAAEHVDEQVADLRAAAGDSSLDDGDVIAAGTALSTATAEADRAESKLTRLRAEALKTKVLADDTAGKVTEHALAHQLPAVEDQLDSVAEAVDAASKAVANLSLAIQAHTAADDAFGTAHSEADSAQQAATDADADHREKLSDAAQAGVEAQEAADALGRDDQQQLDRGTQLEQQIKDIDLAHSTSIRDGLEKAGTASDAEAEHKRLHDALLSLQHDRQEALDAWWTPVDAGLAAARKIPDPAARDLDAALDQARTVVQTLRIAGWPEHPGDKAKRVQTLRDRVLGGPLVELGATLLACGGRSAAAVDADERSGLPTVVVVVDASGTQLSPADAVRHLNQLVDKLAASHDEKLNQIYTELLESTFIEHLRDRLRKVINLIKTVNHVLERHPTGANKTTLRLRRQAAEGQRAGYTILKALDDGTITSAAAQEQVRAFLQDRIREVQDNGAASAEDWIDHLAALLDYRNWFDVVAEYAVDGGSYKPLTRQVHSVDSGGGKVVTLLQPLLATLVALYTESDHAPRPLWLDEAFEGVDPVNRATMLRLLVDFDLDFLLAGPVPLVAAAQVPSAAIWTVSRAPAPAAGVDLSLMLWAGRTLQPVPVADHTRPPAPRRPTDEPDLFEALDNHDGTTA